MIIVQVFPPYDNRHFLQSQDDYKNLDAFGRGNTVIARTSPSSGGPARITYVLDGANLRATDTVRRIGGRVFLLSLESANDDPQTSAYEQALDSVAASISLTSATPGRATPAP